MTSSKLNMFISNPSPILTRLTTISNFVLIGRGYEIKLPEAFTWSQYFFAMIKVITYEGYS